MVDGKRDGGALGADQPDAKKQKVAEDSDDEDLGLGSSSADEGPAKQTGFKGLLAGLDMSDDSDDESAPSDSEDDKKAKGTEKTGDEKPSEGDAKAAPGDEGKKADDAGAASDSEDSSSSSSSSSSSESSSEDEAEASVVGRDFSISRDILVPEDKEGVIEENKALMRRNELLLMRSVTLRRDEVIKMLVSLPEDAAERGLVHSFVRLTVAVDPRRGHNPNNVPEMCLYTEIVGIEHVPVYSVCDRNGESIRVEYNIKCKRGSSIKEFTLSSISNQDVTDEEYDQWKAYMGKLGMDAEYNLARMKAQLENIKATRNFTFTEQVVSGILQKKGGMEFEAQKESRLKSLVQASISQMDITNFRENDSVEVVEKYNATLHALNTVEENTFAVQGEWFSARSNLYSLKEINRKNLGRQTARDHHALMYTYAQEGSGTAGLNPFQRRDCRPESAWDTKLTTDEALGAPASLRGKDLAAGAADGKAADGSGNANAPVVVDASDELVVNKLESIMKAHRRCNLLSKFNFMVAQPSDTGSVAKKSLDVLAGPNADAAPIGSAV